MPHKGETYMGAKILFLDLDGTLFNDEKKVTPDNRLALEAARASGCRIAISTGRALPGAMGLVKELGLTGKGCYVSASNGGVLYDCAAGKVLARRFLAVEDAEMLLAYAREHRLHAQTYDRDGVVVKYPFNEPLVREYCRINAMPWRVVGELASEIDEPPVKVLLVGDEARVTLEEAKAWMGSHMPGRVESYYSSPTFLDVMPAGVNKGYGVTALCRRLGIDVKDAVAAGDEANDIPMLRAAGVGAAMCNAAPEVKAAADYVTTRDNNHSGVAEIVERFCL